MGSGAWAPTCRMTIRVREARRADLGAVIAIERVSFSDPWTNGMFGVHLVSRDGNTFLVAEDDERIVGYTIAQTVREESELLNIAVDPARRNCGVGALLLDAAMERCSRGGGRDMWLEVRASNAGARTLYDARGFVPVAVRKRYYHAPQEDAIVLRAELRATARNETVTGPGLGLNAERVDSILSPATHFPRQETK